MPEAQYQVPAPPDPCLHCAGRARWEKTITEWSIKCADCRVTISQRYCASTELQVIEELRIAWRRQHGRDYLRLHNDAICELKQIVRLLGLDWGTASIETVLEKIRSLKAPDARPVIFSGMEFVPPDFRSNPIKPSVFQLAKDAALRSLEESRKNNGWRDTAIAYAIAAAVEAAHA